MEKHKKEKKVDDDENFFSDFTFILGNYIQNSLDFSRNLSHIHWNGEHNGRGRRVNRWPWRVCSVERMHELTWYTHFLDTLTLLLQISRTTKTKSSSSKNP